MNCLVSVLNKSITRLGVNLDESCTVLCNRFKKKVRSVLVKIRQKQGGRDYEDYVENGFVLFDIKKNEIIRLSELVQQVNSLETKVECLTDDASRKAESLKRVVMEKSLLVQSSVVAARLPFNHGKLYDDVQERQKQRKVKTIKTAIEQALFFLQCLVFF